MVKRNFAFSELQSSYLFVEIANRQKKFREANPNAKVISLGIGDTTEPLLPTVVNGLKEQTHRLSTREGYVGYGEYNGQEKLRQCISRVIYKGAVAADEIFISDGSKPDLARLQFLFGPDTTVAVQDPVYPVYVDSSVISGKGGTFNPETATHSKIIRMPCRPDTNFFPNLDVLPRTDLIFFCSPNNPTGAVATREQLARLVNFAKKNKSIIIYDAAYAEFITDSTEYPKSIFEIEGAREVAIETNSFSKTLGFTGVRLGWTVCPHQLKFDDGHAVRQDWARIMGTFFNGPSNISEAGALAALSDCSGSESATIREMTDLYMSNAKVITHGLKECGLEFYGGVYSPYIWLKVPDGQTSWEVFQELLDKTHVVTTPGEGFGSEGKDFIRLSAFAYPENVTEAMKRILTHFKGKKMPNRPKQVRTL